MAKNRGAGRPCKLTNKVHDKLVEWVEKGNWYTVACSACSITYSVFNLWMNKGEELMERYEGRLDKIPKDELKYFTLFDAIKKAEAFVESEAIDGMLHNRDWKAQATYLERKYPSRWGRVDRHKVDLDVTDLTELTEEELEKIRDE